jgi:hypothetical protein
MMRKYACVTEWCVEAVDDERHLSDTKGYYVLLVWNIYEQNVPPPFQCPCPLQPQKNIHELVLLYKIRS